MPEITGISSVSDITIDDVISFARLPEQDATEQKLIATFLDGARSYIANHTGIPQNADEGEESLDDFPEFVIVALVLCQDMYDNRTLYIEKDCPNMFVKTSLDMHTRNNLV